MMDSIPVTVRTERGDTGGANSRTPTPDGFPFAPPELDTPRSHASNGKPEERAIPVGDDRDEILRWALDRSRAGRGVALATVVETWGSAPRLAGSQMAIDCDGDFVGSVSGGCVEATVLTEAADVIAGGQASVLDFGVSAARAWTAGLACGGRIRILVEPFGRLVPGRDGSLGPASPSDLDVVERLLEARTQRRAVVHATSLDGGSHRLIHSGDSDPLASEAEAALATDHACLVETHAGPVLLNPFSPALRLLVVGAVHIAEPLVRLAALLGFAVTVIDPREAFLRPDRFRGAELIGAWPEEAFAVIGIDARTAVVALTHDPKIDDIALAVASVSPAFYVGALGSHRSHSGRLERLAAAGIHGPALDRIDGPIGLTIGAEGPAEIAVAIAAGIVESLRGGRP